MKSNTKIIGAIIGVIAVVIVASLFIGDSETSDYSAAALSAPHSTFDFHEIKMGDGIVEHEFVVENHGDEAVTIQKVYTSCMCTSTNITDASGKTFGPFGMQGHGASPFTEITIDPGETARVMAVFDPAAHGPSGVGLAKRSIYLETNSAMEPKLELTFQAMVINN